MSLADKISGGGHKHSVRAGYLYAELDDANVAHKHHICKWITVEAGNEISVVEPSEIATVHGLPESVWVRHLEGEMKSERDVLSLPWALLSTILFALMLLQHESVSTENSSQKAFKDDITQNANFAFTGNFGAKNYQDVNSHADFWSWMNKGFMPLTNTHNVPVSEDSGLDLGPLSNASSYMYLWHNRKLAPIKLSQQTVKDMECINQAASEAYDIKCTGSLHIDMLLRPMSWQIAQSAFDEDVEQTIWLNGWRDDTRKLVETLETQRWLGPRTDMVKVSMLTYQADRDMVLLTDVNFLFARSGHIWKSITQRVMKLTPYADFWDYIFDILFYLQLTWVCVEEVKEMVHNMQSGEGAYKGFVAYMGIWNAVDWFYILAGYVFLILWIVRVKEIEHVRDEILSFDLEALECTSDCGAHFSKVFFDVETAGYFTGSVRVFGAVVPMIFMLRLFKAFSAQPRLALVTDTLKQASSNLAHYLVVFTAIFFTYATMAVALFGRQIESFATLDRAVPSTFRLLMGDFEFKKMEVIGRQYAFLFFFSFMWLLNMVMVSMLIAIIMDVYVDVKANAAFSHTIWSEAWDIAGRAYLNRKKARILLLKIRPAFDANSEDLLSISDIMTRVPLISRKQATRLMENAATRFLNDNPSDIQLDGVKSFVDEIYNTLGSLPEIVSGIPVKGAPSHRNCSKLAEEVPLDQLLAAASLKLHSNLESDWLGSKAGIGKLIESAQLMAKSLDQSPFWS